MNAILISIPISIILVAIAVWLFFWAVRSGQYDDLDSPAYSILLDDEERRRRSPENNDSSSPAKDDNTGGENRQ